jgi:KipI family sensor histidine kinase inhibitor
VHRIVPLGDHAVLAEFSERLDLEINARIQRLARAIQLRRAPWVRDVVPALASLALHLDRGKLARGASALEAARALIDECLAQPDDAEEAARTMELPVCYDADFAPDLADVAARCKLSADEVARLHAASAHRVLMVGFVPGHPYIGGLDPKVSVPRRATPRQRVPAGSLAIANAQTVIYPFASPSGWSVIGRTPQRLLDVRRSPPVLLLPGDRVRIVAIGRDEFERRARES